MSYIWDRVLGFAFAFALLRNYKLLSNAFVDLNDLLEIRMHVLLEWLMGWPAGLKLNGPLSRFLGELYLWVLQLWSIFITPHRSKLILSFLLLSISSALLLGFQSGANFSLFSVDALTLPLTLSYLLSSRLFKHTQQTLLSLFRLFRGRRWNELRRRTDAADFSLDQLLLWTVMFAGLGLCAPTIAVYYVLFLSFRLAFFLATLPIRMQFSLAFLHSALTGKFIEIQR